MTVSKIGCYLHECVCFLTINQSICCMFLIAKLRFKLNKVGKSTRQFRYDLNQIPYVYTVEVRNRFKGLDLIDRLPEEIWRVVHCKGGSD